MGLPTVAIRKPVLVAMIFVACVVLGLISLFRLPIELYQGQNQGIISIVVRARGGLAPVEVEKSITRPVEEAVATVSKLKTLYSSSREAESRVTLEFEPGTNMQFSALEIREKFSRVIPLLPKEIEKPVIANYDDAQAAILVFALTSNSLSPEDIRASVESEIKPILSRIDGIASVEIYGGRERKILVELDRDKMVAYNISAEKVMDILGQANVNLLAGSMDAGKMKFAIRSMGAFNNVEEIGDLGVQATRQGSIIPLKEIATVKDSYSEAEDESRLNLENNVTVYVKKTSMANTIPVAKAVRYFLDQFKETHGDTMNIILVTDKAQIVSDAIEEVKETLYVGMMLTIILIYVFLRRWVLSLIVLISLPISIITTFVIMDFFHISINVMTLSGLSLAHGILVDSSIVILENIFVKKEKGYSDLRAIQEGSEEVWLPLLASLVATLIVFLPILFIDKKIQILYTGFAITVSGSLIVSFFVAQMLVPMLLTKWARGKITVRHKIKGPTKVQLLYRRVMEWNLKLRYPVAALFTALFIFSGYKIAHKDIDHPSTFQENEFAAVIFPLAGARLESNSETVKKVEEILRKIPDVEMFNSTIRKDDARIFIRLKAKSKRMYSKDEIMKILDEKGNEGVKQIHDDYSMIIDEGEGGGGDQRKLIVNIFGNDGDTLEKLANEYAKRMGQVPGLSNIVMTDLRKRAEYALVVDKGRAAMYGLSVKSVADSVHALVRGMRPTKFRELSKGQEIEVITRLQAVYRQKIDDLRYLYIQTPNGNQVTLGEIASFQPVTGPQTIDRKDKYRYVFVKADTKGAIETVAKQVKELIKDVKLPDEYYWRFGGIYEELLQGKAQLSTALILTVFLVYMVMACLFESYLQPLLVMISVPMASIGIWIALTVTKKSLSENVFVGMILLAGYVVNAAVIMVDHTNRLRARGTAHDESLIQAGMDRLRPITMTTLSTSLGFLPMALSWGSSSELWAPLAVTVIGGLLSSTLLTLFVLPNFILIAEDMTAGVRWIFGWVFYFAGFIKNRFLKFISN